MAVFEYLEGNGQTKFIGFRVVRSFGSSDDVRQEYFSLKKMSYDEARKAAYELDSKWEKEAQKVSIDKGIEEFRTHSQKALTSTSKIIAPGFRAYIGLEKRKVNGQVFPYVFPCFIVSNPGKKDKTFRINSLGYDAAFIAALKYYRETREISDTQALSLMARLPDKKTFTEQLRAGVLDRGVKVTKTEILEKLQQKQGK